MEPYVFLVIAVCLAQLVICTSDKNSTNTYCPQDYPCKCLLHMSFNNYTQINIDCQNLGMRSVPDVSFIKDLANTDVHKLDLSNNRLSSLDENTFSGLQHVGLRNLFLSNNSIQSISGQVFKGLDYLEDIDLTDNDIGNLHPDTFVGLEDNKLYLGLQNIGLKGFPRAALKNLRHIIMVDLDNNQIHVLPDYLLEDFQIQQAYFWLYLNNNSISEISPKVFKTRNTTNVILSELKLKANKLHNVDFLKDPCDTVFRTKDTWVHLNDNPLHCDCGLFSVVNSGFFAMFGECASPAAYKGVNIKVHSYMPEYYGPPHPKYDYDDSEFVETVGNDCVNNTIIFDMGCAFVTEPEPSATNKQKNCVFFLIVVVTLLYIL